jgi:hypothetical protein
MSFDKNMTAVDAVLVLDESQDAVDEGLESQQLQELGTDRKEQALLSNSMRRLSSNELLNLGTSLDEQVVALEKFAADRDASINMMNELGLSLEGQAKALAEATDNRYPEFTDRCKRFWQAVEPLTNPLVGHVVNASPFVEASSVAAVPEGPSVAVAPADDVDALQSELFGDEGADELDCKVMTHTHAPVMPSLCDTDPSFYTWTASSSSRDDPSSAAKKPRL